MQKSKLDTQKKKHGPPSPGGHNHSQLIRMNDKLTAEIDDWREQQDDVTSRPEAIRRLVEIGLNARAETIEQLNEAQSHAAQAKKLATQLGLKFAK